MVLGEEAQDVGGEVVVVLLERVAAGLGERVDAGRAAAAAGGGRTVGRLLAGLGVALGDQDVEVAADRGGGELQPRGEVGGGGRTVLEQRARDPGAGVRALGLAVTA